MNQQCFRDILLSLNLVHLQEMCQYKNVDLIHVFVFCVYISFGKGDDVKKISSATLAQF